MANVKVAVRVRPLSKRESAEGGRVIVEVDGKVAKVRNIKVDSRLDGTWDSRERTVVFSFDYCYWSVDPEDPNYASQEMNQFSLADGECGTSAPPLCCAHTMKQFLCASLHSCIEGFFGRCLQEAVCS